MFERLTAQAQRVLFFARFEASQLGSMDIDTEHLLLGLIRESKGLTNRLFAEAGVALDDIRDDGELQSGDEPSARRAAVSPRCLRGALGAVLPSGELV